MRDGPLQMLYVGNIIPLKGMDLALEALAASKTEVRFTLIGDGDFLVRMYRSPKQYYIDFFLAYFPTQRTGSTIHSPQNCLPGSGWIPAELKRIPLTGAGESGLVNRYIISKGLDRQLVIYWYQSNGRIVASEYWAKVYLVADSIRRNRSDGALVRIVTPIVRDETVERALIFVSGLGHYELHVNGRPVGEFGEGTLCAAQLGIRTIFASGDLALTKEAEALVPGIETVARTLTTTSGPIGKSVDSNQTSGLPFPA